MNPTRKIAVASRCHSFILSRSYSSTRCYITTLTRSCCPATKPKNGSLCFPKTRCYSEITPCYSKFKSRCPVVSCGLILMCSIPSSIRNQCKRSDKAIPYISRSTHCLHCAYESCYDMLFQIYVVIRAGLTRSMPNKPCESITHTEDKRFQPESNTLSRARLPHLKREN